MLSELELNKKIEHAIDIVQIAAMDLKKIRKEEMQINYKNNNLQDIVTNKDIMTERRIVEYLSTVFEEDGFITEENTVDFESKKGIWILDPIDGTTNFANTLKDYAISLAYYYENEPKFGIICDVARNQLYVGIKGKGAYLDEKPLAKLEDRPFNKSVFDISLRSIFKFEDDYGVDFRKLVEEITAFRSIGSAALAIAHVAAGDIQLYGSKSLKIWDYAAGAIILEEVGGYIYVSEEEGDNRTPHVIIAATSREVVDKFKNYK